MWWCGNGWYMGWWGPILGLLWFVLLGLFVYWLVRALARGEIDKETFERMKRDLA